MAIDPNSDGISPPSDQGQATATNNWDVDGDGTTDFVLRKHFSTATYAPFEVFAAYIDETAGGKILGVGNGDRGQFEVVASNDPIGSSAAFNTETEVNEISVAFDGVWQTGSAVDGIVSTGGSVNFGFSITISGNTHYGWGSIAIPATPSLPENPFTITQAYYESLADTPITVGAVPEPAHLALLTGLGAAASMAYRRKRRPVGH